MLVRDYMRKDPCTISDRATILEARDIMQREGAHTLSVMEEKKVIGIVTEGAVSEAGPSSLGLLQDYEWNYLLPGVRVGDIMSRMVVSVSPYATIEDAAKLLLEKKIRDLPVLEDGELVGLITINDILCIFNSLSVETERVADIELKLDGETQSLTQALKIIVAHEANIISVETESVGKGVGSTEVILGIEGEDVCEIKKELLAEDLLLCACKEDPESCTQA